MTMGDMYYVDIIQEKFEFRQICISSNMFFVDLNYRGLSCLNTGLLMKLVLGLKRR